MKRFIESIYFNSISFSLALSWTHCAIVPYMQMHQFYAHKSLFPTIYDGLPKSNKRIH